MIPEWEDTCSCARELWTMTITVAWGNGAAAEFVVTNPYIHSKDSWQAFARGELDELCFTRPKDAEDSLQLFNGEFLFGATSGDAFESQFTCPWSEIAGPLKAAVEKAVEEGMPFADRQEKRHDSGGAGMETMAADPSI